MTIDPANDALLAVQALRDCQRYYGYAGPGIRATDRVEAAIRALLAERTWQPIQTAPKDGTEILLYAGGSGIGQWDDMLGWWSEGNFMNNPTHWMPLPTDPMEPS